MCVYIYMACLVVLIVNNLPANAGDERDTGWIPELGRSAGVGSGNHSSILAWKIPWTEGQRSQLGYSSVAAKSRTQLSTEQIHVVSYFTVNHFNFHLQMDFI